MNADTIGDLLSEFWQTSSDACPLEVSEAEKQEVAFKAFVAKKMEAMTFEEASSFVMMHMAVYCHPHSTSIITSNSAELFESIKVFKDDKYLID